MILLNILLSILLISASALCIYLIIFLKRFNTSLDEIKLNIEKVVEESLPVLSNLNKIAEDATSVTSAAERQVMDLNNRIDEFKDKIDTYKSKFSKASTDNQIVSMINNVRAFIKGLSAFVQEFNK